MHDFRTLPLHVLLSASVAAFPLAAAAQDAGTPSAQDEQEKKQQANLESKPACLKCQELQNKILTLQEQVRELELERDDLSYQVAELDGSNEEFHTQAVWNHDDGSGQFPHYQEE